MFHLTALARTVDRAKVQWHQLAHALNIVSCGLMIGSAMFDPISAAESHRYCEIILPTFATSLLVWLALNLGAFMSVGRYSIPLGLIILLLVAIQGEPTSESFTAWLPLYAATVGIITTSVHHFLKQVLWATEPSFRNDGDDVSWPESTTGQQQETQQIPAITRWMGEPLQPLARYVLGQCSHQVSPSEGSAATLSLSSTGRVRTSWGSHVRGFWDDLMAPSYGGNPSDRSEFDLPNGRDNREFERHRSGSPSVETEVGSTTRLTTHDEGI